MIVIAELVKAFRRAKDRGIREGIRYLRGQIYSTSRYHVFRHTLETIPDVSVELSNMYDIEICDSDDALVEEMYPVWPSEFGPPDAKYVAGVLQERARDGALCCVLRHSGRFVGAVWVSLPNHWYSSLPIPYVPGEGVSQGLFIVPSYRGMGLSKMLKINCLQIAKQRGISSIIGLVSVKNTASMRMCISVGCQTIGLLTQYNRLFKYSQSFVEAESSE